MSNLSSEGDLYGTIEGYPDVIDYNALTNKPQINGIEVEGDHGGHYYGLANLEDITTGISWISWEDYKALPEEKKMDGTAYFIPDGEAWDKGTASGSVASFNDGSDAPIISANIDIDTPGSGWITNTLNATGKNMIDVKEYQIPSNSSTNTIMNCDVTGTFTISIDKSQITEVINPTSLFMRLEINGSVTSLSYNIDSYSFTGNLTSIRVYGSGAYARATGKITLQLEEGLQATTYEEYNGTIYDIEINEATGEIRSEEVIKTTEGTNNFWSSAGDIEIEYWKDSGARPQIRCKDIIFSLGVQ